MKLLLSSAILAQILSSSTTTNVAGEKRRFSLNKKRRASRVRRLGKQLLSSFTPNTNPAEIRLVEVKPLRNTHRDVLDHVSFPHLTRSSSNENNDDVVEADVGLLAYQSSQNFAGEDVGIMENEDPGRSRRLESYCDYLNRDGALVCDCSQVDKTTYMGTASCLYTSERSCICPDMDLEKKFCYSVTSDFVLEGDFNDGGNRSATNHVCYTFDDTFLEESPAPVFCMNYSYDADGVGLEECTLMLGGQVCNSCTQSSDGCIDFDCENLDPKATGTQVGNTCEDEWPLVTLEFLTSGSYWDDLEATCPVEPSDHEDDAMPQADTPKDCAVHTTPSSSLSTVVGAGMLFIAACLFAVV